MSLRRYLTAATLVVAFVFLVIGSATIVMGVQGKAEARAALAAEKITIPGDPEDEAVPPAYRGKNVPVTDVTTMEVMRNVVRAHTLESTEGQVYAEMPRFLEDEQGNPVLDEQGNPVKNQARDIWVTSTAWQTSLNLGIMAFRIADFVVIVGTAFLIVGATLLGVGLPLVRRTTRLP